MAVSPALGTPTLDRAGFADQGIALTFVAGAEPAGLTVASYDYEISTDGGATVVYDSNTVSYVGSYGNTSAIHSPYTDPIGASYCQVAVCSYRIRAEMDSNEWQTAWSAWVAVSPPLSAPTLNGVHYVNQGIALSFSAPSLPAGSTVTSYDYEISTDGGATDAYDNNTVSYVGSYGNTSATHSPYTDPNAPSFCQLATCSYRIRAEVGANEWQTPWSGWVTVSPAFAAPTLTGVRYVNQGIALSFSAPSLPAGSTVTSYDYEISTDGGASVAFANNTASYVGSYGNTSATHSPYTDPNAPSFCEPPATCSYRIRAEVGANEWQTPWSAQVPVLPVLKAPALVSARFVTGGVSLAVTAPSVPSGSTITSYDYDLSTDGGTTVVYEQNTSTVGSPYLDPSGPYECPVGTTCSYRIRGEIGANLWQTPWSAWVAVSTPTYSVCAATNPSVPPRYYVSKIVVSSACSAGDSLAWTLTPIPPSGPYTYCAATDPGVLGGYYVSHIASSASCSPGDSLAWTLTPIPHRFELRGLWRDRVVPTGRHLRLEDRRQLDLQRGRQPGLDHHPHPHRCHVRRLRRRSSTSHRTTR